MIELGIILNVLKDKQKGSSTDGSGILYLILLSLPVGQTHAQQMSHKVGGVKGQYFLCSLGSHWAVVQAW